MHASSLENMRKCYRKFIAGQPLESKSQLKVLDVGGANVNGSYADVFNAPNIEYVAADLKEGDGVRIVLEDPTKIPLPSESIDIILSGQMLEHCERFWLVFEEMVRVLKPDGWLFLVAPSAGPIHRFPVDCYRFYPDAYRSLAKHSDCYLIDVWKDNRGPWNDLVGAFNKTGIKPDPKNLMDDSQAKATNEAQAYSTPELEKISGEISYLKVLETIHQILEPKLYLEIGVREGRSLILAKGDAVGVDPAPDVQITLPESTRLETQTSDDFFENGSDPVLQSRPDFVFIDGMHLSEFVLRDFMHVERYSTPNTVVVLDGILPNVPEQASRERNTQVWCGDVWKICNCLKLLRPDLTLIQVDAAPTGLLLIAGLDPDNTILWEKYNYIVAGFTSLSTVPPVKFLKRRIAIKPSSQTFKSYLNILKNWRDISGTPEALAKEINRKDY